MAALTIYAKPTHTFIDEVDSYAEQVLLDLQRRGLSPTAIRTYTASVQKIRTVFASLKGEMLRTSCHHDLLAHCLQTLGQEIAAHQIDLNAYKRKTTLTEGLSPPKVGGFAAKFAATVATELHALPPEYRGTFSSEEGVLSYISQKCKTLWKAVPPLGEIKEKAVSCLEGTLWAPYPDALPSREKGFTKTFDYYSSSGFYEDSLPFSALSAFAMSLLAEVSLRKWALESRGKETVILLMPRRDSNYFTHHPATYEAVKTISRGRKLVIRRISSGAEMGEVLLRYKNVSHLYIAAHGTPKGIQFDKEARSADCSWADCFTAKPTVILHSCSTGAKDGMGGEKRPGAAEKMHKFLCDGFAKKFTVIAANNIVVPDSVHVKGDHVTFYDEDKKDITVKFGAVESE